MRELSALEMSALCSNLARGCEKQYKSEESELFTQLADYFKSVSPSAKDPSFDELIKLIEKTLDKGFQMQTPYAKMQRPWCFACSCVERKGN